MGAEGHSHEGFRVLGLRVGGVLANEDPPP